MTIERKKKDRGKTSLFEEFTQREFKSIKSRSGTFTNIRNPNKDPRITINVRGHKYETYLGVY